MPVYLELLFILFLLLANGIFAMSELAVVSARKVRLQHRASQGNAGARAALELAENPGFFLSTVQVGITLIGIMAGAFGGATLTEELAVQLQVFPSIAPYAEQISFGVVVLIITYFSLVIGELIPKRIALHNPDRIAAFVAAPMKRLSVLTAPLVRVLEASTSGALRLIGLRESGDEPVTEEEIRLLIEQGVPAGVFQEAERDVIERVFHLGDRRVRELMVPRTEIVWFDLNESHESIRQKLSSNHYSRYPVIQNSPDNVVGIVRAKDLLAHALDRQPPDLRAVLQKPVFVPETMSVFRVIETFKQARRHIAMVVDEHGGLEGLVTINDVLDALVGDIPSFDERREQMIIRREDDSLLINGSLSISELKKALQLRQLPYEEESGYQTLGGLVMQQLGRVPGITDHFEYGDWRFEVMNMDRNRVDRVLVTPVRRGKGTD